MRYEQKNLAGNYFDDRERFRLVANVTKNDDKSHVLRRMLAGTVVAYRCLNEACAAQEEFIRLAAAVSGSFASYGLTAVVDERDGIVHNVLHLS
jgi:hypothetical protein